jgi:hypothetical protein
MLLFYAFENRNHWCIFGFAICCILSSIYGFLQGAWPFGLLEIIWTFVALHKWRAARKYSTTSPQTSSQT